MGEATFFVEYILFIYTVLYYTGLADAEVRYGGRVYTGAMQVLAETGGAVSALTPREHTVLRQQNSWLQAAER